MTVHLSLNCIINKIKIMKTLYTLLFSILISVSLDAQVFESKQDLSVGTQNAFAMDHPDAEKKMVEDALDDAIKAYGKVKRNRKAKEWNCAECKIPTISSSPISISYKVEEGKGQVTSYLFFDNGTEFLSSDNSDKAAAIEKLNMDIFYDVKKRVISKELENEEEGLKDFNKDLSKLEKKNKDLHNDIEDYKEKIRKAEKEIEQNLQSQEDKKIEIEQQKNKVTGITDKLNNVGRGK